MFLEKTGRVLIKPAAGSMNTKPQALACDVITNVRVVRVDPIKPYVTRFGQEGTAQTIVAEDLDIAGHNHRLTAYKENVEKFGSLFEVGSVIEAIGLRTRNFGFNILDFKVLKAAPAPAPVEPEQAAA